MKAFLKRASARRRNRLEQPSDLDPDKSKRRSLIRRRRNGKSRAFRLGRRAREGRIDHGVSHQSRIYHGMSHVYDRIFTRVLGPRIHQTLGTIDIQPGAKILEMGIGTGLSLGAYPEHAEVTGIDLAADMLAQAARKVEQAEWSNVTLTQMDATATDFPDGYFDYVTAFHLVSVVPDAGKLLREMARVCKPGGTMVIINHFRSEKRWLAPLVDVLDPVTRRLGWRTTLRYADLFAAIPAQVEQRFKTSRRSLFTVVIARKTPQGTRV